MIGRLLDWAVDFFVTLQASLQKDGRILAESARRRKAAWKALTAPLTIDPNHFDWIDKNLQKD